MRRGPGLIAVLLVVLAVGLAVATVRTNQRLADRLVDDVAAFRARKLKLTRPDGAESARVEDGLRCQESVLSTAPSDLKPFSDGSQEATSFARGDLSMAELPESVRVRVDALRPWVEAMRDCSDAERLGMVDSFEPWSPKPLLPKLVAVMRHSAIDVRLMLAADRPELALEACTEAMELSLDASRTSLVGAMSSTTGLRLLARACSEAWAASSPQVRALFAPRWVLLPTRFTSDAEVMESERLAVSVALFSGLASAEVRAKLPPSSLAFTRVDMVGLRRAWGSWDSAMRALAAANDPASRAAASEVLEASTHRWWLPDSPGLNGGVHYDKFFARLESQRVLLGVLTSIATGGKTPLPPGLTTSDGWVQVIDADGGATRLKL